MTEGIQQLPCQRCLRNRVLCIKVDGPRSRCRACTQAGTRLCSSDLKDVKPFLPRWVNVPEFRSPSARNLGAVTRQQEPLSRSRPDLDDGDHTECRVVHRAKSNSKASNGGAQELGDNALLPLFDGDRNDVGYITLRFYLSHPPKTRSCGPKPETLPCRRCLSQRLTCIRENGPNNSCRACIGALKGACRSNLKGVKPYLPRYSMVPDLESLHNQRLDDEVLTESQLDESDDEVVELSTGTEGSVEPDDLLDLFDGDVNDSGFKTLQLYLANPPMKSHLKGLYCSPIPCRRCLGQRIWCAKTSKSDSKCRSCKKQAYCSHDLKSVRPDWRRYHHLPGFDPNLCAE